MGTGQDSGVITPQPYAYYDPESLSLRTFQLSLLTDSTEYCQTLPRAGTMQNGIVYQRVASVPLTAATGYSSLPTPTVAQAPNKNGNVKRYGPAKSLPEMARTGSWGDKPETWPTPRASDGTHGGLVTPRKSREGGNLIEAVSARMWPTPTVQDASNNGGPSQHHRNSKPLNAAVGGALNPTWVEWLQGFPAGWTAIQ